MDNILWHKSLANRLINKKLKIAWIFDGLSTMNKEHVYFRVAGALVSTDLELPVVKTWVPKAETTVDRLTTVQRAAVATAMAKYDSMLLKNRAVPKGGL